MGKVYSMNIEYKDSKRISILETDRSSTQGFAGGNGIESGASYGGGGGGGTGEVGGNASGAYGGSGGDGIANAIVGSTYGQEISGIYYHGGGGKAGVYGGNYGNYGHGYAYGGGGNGGFQNSAGGNGTTGGVVLKLLTSASFTTSGSPSSTTSGSHTILTYTSTSASSLVISSGTVDVQYLLQAGGGGAGGNSGHGGGNGSGGGGAGGTLTGTLSLSAGTYTVSVGAGGAGGTTSGTVGVNGSDSVFSTKTALGGGGGAPNVSTTILAASGGCGGGGAGLTNQINGASATLIDIPLPTNVQDNSILVEKDTGKRYWFDAEISNLALTDPTPASSDYTNSGSSFTFASNKIHADAVGYGSTLTMCTRPLTTTFIPTTNGCMIDFKFDWTTAGGSGNDTGVAVGIFDTRDQADNTNNGIWIEFVTSPSYARNVQFKCEGVFDNSSVQGYPVPDEYYCRIIVQKDGSATGKGYTSEADRTADTNAVFSRSTAAQTGFSEKTIFGILNTRPTGGGNVVGDLDSINVYSGITATTPATWTREIPSFTGSYFMSGGTAAPWTPVNYHDQFNGTTWATASNLPTAVSLNAGTGTKEDGASFGGDTSGTATPVNNNQSWTGSSWSASQAMNTTRNQTTGGGATGSTSGWVAGGRVTSSGNPVNTSEQWNGTSWSTGGNMSGVRRNSGGAGIVTEAWNAGGYTGSAKLDTMELYNGTAWSAGSNIHSPTDGLAQGGGDSYNCFYVGGAEASATIDHTHIYNGTAWSLGNTLTFTVKYNATMGTPQDAITACGYQATGGGWAGVLAATYNGTVWTSSTNVTRGRGTGAGGT